MAAAFYLRACGAAASWLVLPPALVGNFPLLLIVESTCGPTVAAQMKLLGGKTAALQQMIEPL